MEKVHRISIIPRGRALGYTLNLPEEDRYLKTRDELLDYMVVLLGGRVTEHIVFGEITTGASDDLRKVHDISRSMITVYGMGTELRSKQLPADDYSMSDHTRRTIDEERSTSPTSRTAGRSSSWRRTAGCWRRSPPRCSRTRCSTTSSASWPPAWRRARGGGDPPRRSPWPSSSREPRRWRPRSGSRIGPGADPPA